MALIATPKVIFSDIDGTLLDAQRELSEYTMKEIKRVKDHIPVVLVSSRMPSAMYHLQKQLDISDQPLICYNGGLILVKDQILSSTVIPAGLIADLLTYNYAQEFHISLYHNDHWYVDTMDYWAQREMHNTKVQPEVKPLQEVYSDWKSSGKGAHKIMCMGDAEAIARAYQFLTANFGEQLHLYRSKPNYLEIANAVISKETAVSKLLKTHFKIPLQEVIAFGDNYNDIAMLKAAGTGVAVANAKLETLAIADAITLDGKEDGVAAYMRKNIII